MNRALPKLLTLPFLTVGMLAASGQAPAQCRLCERPTTQPDVTERTKELRLDVETSLDFDRLVVLGPGQGSAVLHPDGSRSATGIISAISERAMVGSAVIRGEPGRAVRIDLPQSIQLYSLSGGRIVIEDIVSSLPANARLDSSGGLVFRFGGRLRITGDAEGDYRGEVPITVEYL